MANKKLYVVKNNDKGTYWSAYGVWPTQLRQARIYTSIKYAQEILKRYKDENLSIVEVELKEVDNGKEI